MLRRVCCPLLGLSVASAANAATLSVVPDQLVYNVGDTITLTVFGDHEGGVDYSVFGQLVYSGALVDNGTRTQTRLGPRWNPFPLNAGDDGINAFSRAFDQIAVEPGVTALPGAFSTVTLIAQAVGIVDVDWDDPLIFFDITDPVGTSFTIVPEPTTAALLSLGLLALAAQLRRNSCEV